MMYEAKNESFTLIDLKTWDALYQHSQNKAFTKAVCQFIQHTFSLATGDTIVICCGHLSRCDMAIDLSKQANILGWKVELYTPKILAKQFSDVFTSNTHTKIFDMLQTIGNASLLIDLVGSIHPKKASLRIEKWVRTLSELAVPKIAIEVPSGLNANTGAKIGSCAMNVDYTLSSFYQKQGLWTADAKAFVGKSLVIFPADNNEAVTTQSALMHAEQIKLLAPRRKAFEHKGSFQRVVVVAGGGQMFGAGLMAAKAALIAGAGLVELVYPQGLCPEYGEFPELIWHALSSGFQLAQWIRPDDILVVGPGLGEGKWALEIWDSICQLDNPIVVDASGLHYLAATGGQHPNWIITPHPGEAGILLGCGNHKVQQDRFLAIHKLHQQYQATVVLKGSGTMVLGSNQEIQICPLGHPGMATPGMGDILTGLIAGAWAQGLTASDACVFAVWLHANAADIAKQKSMNEIVLASQVLSQIQYGGGTDL